MTLLDQKIMSALKEARADLAGALARNDMNQKDLAGPLGVDVSTIYNRLRKKDSSFYDRLAEVWPPALIIAADLHRRLAEAYHSEFETLRDGIADPALARARAEIERLRGAKGGPKDG